MTSSSQPLIVYGIPFSQPVRAVVWLLLYKQMPFNLVPINPGSKGDNGSRSPGFLAKNPAGTIPTIEEPQSGFVLGEANAILSYLCNRHGWDDVYPSDPQRRAKVDWYLHYHHRNVRDASIGFVAPKIRKDLNIPEAIQQSAQASFTRAVRALDTGWLAQSRFLTGDSVSLADFAAYMEIGQLQPGFTNLFDFAPYPNVNRWLGQMKQVRAHDDAHLVLAELGDISVEPPTIETIKNANGRALMHLKERVAAMAGGAAVSRQSTPASQGPHMEDLRIMATGLGFPEGPVACADGSVVLTEIRHGRCTRVMPDGQVSVFSACGGGPNGLAVGPDGYFYLCNNGGSRYVAGHSMGVGPHPDYKHGSIQRIDPKSGEATLLYREADGHPLSAPNDLVFDSEGGFYFTDLGKRYPRHRDHGGVYYARPDGSSIAALAYPMLSSNGCGLSPDGRILYVADTEGARLWAFEVQGPGRLKPKGEFTPHSGRVIAGLGGNARFDSLAVMASGNIVVATLSTGFITEFSPAGEVVRAVQMPDRFPTNICFGGPDMCTAYITLSDTGRLGVMRWPEPGLKLNFS